MVCLRYLLVFIFGILVFSNLSFAKESMDIDITLSKNDIVTERITLNILADQSYDSVEFTTFLQPLTVLYDGEYSISQEDDAFVIIFDKNIVVGENIITFTLVYDEIIEGNNKNKVFRTSFYPENSDSVIISLTLPTYHALSDIKPSVTPKPSYIESDGQRITLYWKFLEDEQADIAVFYQGEDGFNTIIISLIAILIISIAVFLYFKNKTRKHISQTLSSEELKVVDELRKGVKKQKEIAINLDFSKSKMSKLISKLEEKDLIEKKPYFKTNIIILSRKIK